MAANIETIRQTILKQCEDEDGFISQLHINNRFADTEWQLLVEALDAYALATQDDNVIDKRIAGAIFFAYQIIGNALAHHQRVHSPLYSPLAAAHHQIWELSERVFSSD